MPRKKPRRYSDDDRASALAALAANGGNVNHTARQLGMSETTLRQWASGKRHPEAAQMSEQKKGELWEEFGDVCWLLLGVVREKVSEMSGKDAMIAAGIAAEKRQLLKGEPTTINESRDDARMRQFADRYAEAHAEGDAGADGGGQPPDPPRPDGPADPVPRAGVP